MDGCRTAKLAALTIKSLQDEVEELKCKFKELRGALGVDGDISFLKKEKSELWNEVFKISYEPRLSKDLEVLRKRQPAAFSHVRTIRFPYRPWGSVAEDEFLKYMGRFTSLTQTELHMSVFLSHCLPSFECIPHQITEIKLEASRDQAVMRTRDAVVFQQREDNPYFNGVSKNSKKPARE
ncbi:hypothetical protein H0H81_007868 [Sphagnurus paluster]|uniref:Uncharacterized protein n=1 Tax=Sphagnurus paluster TaxID=117069 RepID=A0A9P7GRG6_9AGAR|nr:hypothetical protein H0H81_007868 [Sphagnurus paluster]